MRRSALAGLAAAALLAASAAVADEALRWELGYSHDTPSWVKVPRAGGETEVAWYMTYRVENATGAERKPALRTEIHTDTKKVYADTVNPVVVKAVEKKLKAKDLATALTLKKGIADGSQVKAVATFGPIDDHAQELELRVYGLTDPVTRVKGKAIHEVRFWSVKYERKGDEFGRTGDPWKKLSEGWVVESSEVLPGVGE